MILNIEKHFKISRKKKGFALQLDATGWLVAVLIIIAIGLVGIPQLRSAVRSAGQQLELYQIRNAISQYESLRADGQPPDDLDQLLADPSIEAADAIDGQDHGPMLAKNARWENGVVDMWGEAYTYTVNADGTGTITSDTAESSIDF